MPAKVPTKPGVARSGAAEPAKPADRARTAAKPVAKKAPIRHPAAKRSAAKRLAGATSGTKVPKAAGRLTHEEADLFFARLAEANPEPRGELDYVNAYTLLVAVVLSAQATDAGVNRATKDLFAKVDTPQKMLDLGLDGLIRHIRTIGLFNTKAKNVMELSRLLIARHGGEVPRDRDALQALPGVGRKTANVVLNIAFGEPTMAVDTHVFRVSNRTGLAAGKTPLEVEEKLMAIIPERWALHAHYWLILHGRYTCVARKPNCPDCVVRDICRFTAKTTAL